MGEDDDGPGCLHIAANTGFVVALCGALLYWGVPGGLWSDIPGAALMVIGVITEIVCTIVIVAGRAAAWFGRRR